MSDTGSIEHPTWLTSGDFTAADEPFALFAAWFADATASEPSDPNAMALATVDADGLPNARMVLLKGFDERGFRLLHQHRQPKGRRTGRQPQGGACCSIGSRCTGRCASAAPVERVTDAEADAYFATRPKQAQIGAWASKQSQPLESRLAFEKAIALYAAKYALGDGAAAAGLVAAIASCRCASNSGTTARSACMTASNSAASAGRRRGARRGFIRETMS